MTEILLIVVSRLKASRSEIQPVGPGGAQLRGVGSGVHEAAVDKEFVLHG